LATPRQILSYLGSGIIILSLILLSLAWAIFYYPMALSVAGYTQSFGSVINRWWDWIQFAGMGATYFKAFGMVPINSDRKSYRRHPGRDSHGAVCVPFIGNLPARFIDGAITFYSTW